ncbi:hypothetical protein N0V90_006720 [Kalmusia sp. IMI 367209]|nr:hypothetical protein N0V90_006720 [Kalmusia sp. IMI 367209]
MDFFAYLILSLFGAFSVATPTPPTVYKDGGLASNEYLIVGVYKNSVELEGFSMNLSVLGDKCMTGPSVGGYRMDKGYECKFFSDKQCKDFLGNHQGPDAQWQLLPGKEYAYSWACCKI